MPRIPIHGSDRSRSELADGYADTCDMCTSYFFDYPSDATRPAVPLNTPIHVHTYENGLTLLVQPVPHVQSVAFSICLPTGSAADPLGASGAAGLAADWVMRGAGARDHRQLTDHLDNLGVRRAQSAGREMTSFDGVLLSSQLPAVLEAYADILRRPRLVNQEFELARELALQELAALEDVPSAKWSRELWRCCWPFPFSRPAEGIAAELSELSAEALRDNLLARYRPQGAIVAVAGDVDFAAVRDQLGRLLGDWIGSAPAAPTGTDTRRRVSHLTEPTEQTHIGLACSTVAFGDPHYYQLRIALGVLAGGMGARLFTEVREKRSLSYEVSASVATIRGRAMLYAYAKPEPSKADQTLQVLLDELRRICREGIDSAELARAKAGSKSQLVMNGESSRGRAMALANDWFHLGRVRSLDEIAAEIEAVTVESVNDFLWKHRFGEFTLVTLGPTAVQVPELS